MAKNCKYVCQICGTNYNRWQGQCSDCASWNSIEMEQLAASVEFSKVQKSTAYDIEDLSNKNLTAQCYIKSGVEELDRVLGGGLVPGSAVLIAGNPGIGKSTILLQLASKLASSHVCLYVSGEESIAQIKLHTERLQSASAPIKIVSGTNVSSLVSAVENNNVPLTLMIVDSIQTMFVPEIPSAPGTVSQVRTAAHELISLAKKRNFALMIVGHVTKDGQIAGPKVLEHMVDTVLYLEGEPGSDYRILRSVKNRFGSVNEIGVFEMSDHGLNEVSNPSSIFLSERQANVSGSVVFAGLEGTRPILIEVQALVVPSNMVAPRRAVVGWDLNRLSMILAVLAARYGLNLASHEVYLNIVGGLKINEPALDLAVMCALISALKKTPVEDSTVILGEVGLLGEVRKINKLDTRLKEASKLGFKRAIVPRTNKASQSGLQVNEISHIKELGNFFLLST